MEIDTFNKFLVGMKGDNVTIMRMSPLMTKQDALLLAAYLVALADDDNEFAEVLKAVQNT